MTDGTDFVTAPSRSRSPKRLPRAHPLHRRALVAVSAAVLLTCDEAPTKPPNPAQQSDGVHQTTYSGEVEFEQIAATEPAFAGFYYDESTLVVLVNDSTARRAARLEVENGFANLAVEDPVSVPQSFVVREVEYSFLQLRGWRDDALPALDSLPGVTFLDLDEAQNKVAVGVEQAPQIAAVRENLRSLRIPARAIHIEVTGPIAPHGPSPTGPGLDETRITVPQRITVQSRFRPIRGGFQIVTTSYDLDPIFSCTLGFNASLDGKDVFVTNSHCTDVRWATDGTHAYQNVKSSREHNFIAHERYDPPASERCRWWFGIVPIWSKCRRADAAAFDYEFQDVDFERRIARTEWRSVGDSSGSKVIDDNSPYFDVRWRDSYPSHGEWVNKVGMITGWTAGTVSRTCADVWQGGRPGRDEGRQRYKCQYLASFYNWSGDSGSPVFKWNGIGATLTGIFWGGSGWFSPLGGIEADLGSMDVIKERPPTPRPLSVAIVGPDTVQAGDTNTWQASVSGGTRPYSYEWSGLLEGTDSTITGALSQSGSLDLTVTDNAGDEVSTYLVICVLNDDDDPGPFPSECIQ